jgi:hypothetical protein
VRRIAAVFFVTEIIVNPTLGLDPFTDICIELPLTIILDKYNTKLDLLMTPPIN